MAAGLFSVVKTPRAHCAEVKQPEILPVRCTAKHVDQAGTIRQEAHAFPVALQIDFWQLRRCTIRANCQKGHEREHLRATIDDQVPPRSSHRIQNGPIAIRTDAPPIGG